MEKTNHINSCDSRVHAYKNGKTMEQCKEEARENTSTIKRTIRKWRFMDASTRYGDELVYKTRVKLNNRGL